MRTMLTAISLLLTANAYAGEACKDLAKYVGIYVLESKTCNGPFGGDLTVEKRDIDADTPYMIYSGGVGIGPAITENSTDSCSSKDSVFTVQTCTRDSSCLPRGWIYTFSGRHVTFYANGCQAEFVKE